MEILFLGSGNAFNADGRGSPAMLVSDEAAPPFLVDAGPTMLQACARFGVSCGEIDKLFLTHLHGDHTAGWPFFLLEQLSHGRKARPFDVYGPLGTRENLELLTSLCYGDILGKLPFEVRYHELAVEPAKGLDGGGMRFDVLPMQHHRTSIAYRFELGARSLGISGDTGWCSNLEQLAQASDVLVVECSSVEPTPWDHIALRQLREGQGKLGDAELLLVHLTDEVAADLARDPLPRVLATHDGMTYRP